MAAPWSPYTTGLMASALANVGRPEQQREPLLATLRGNSYGGPVGLVIDSLVRGEIETAVEWAGKAAEQRFPVFIPRVVRPFEALFRRSTGWPAVLKKINLAA